MKNDLLRKLMYAGLSLFLISSMPVNAGSVQHHEVLKQRLKSAESTSGKIMPISLRGLSRTSQRFKAPEETAVEYPDSTIVFSAEGEKTYITRFGYDENKRMNYKVEFAKSDAQVIGGEWVKVKEEIVRYDELGRAVYNEFYELLEGIWTGTARAILEYDEYGNKVYQEASKWNTETQKWDNNRKELSEYRADGQNVFTESYYGIGDEWEGEYKELYTYNELGNKIKYQDFEWDEGNWLLVFYTDYVYDEAKPSLLITETEYEEDYATGEFAATSKGMYTYDEKDILKEILWQAWEDGEWLNDTHLLYEYTNGIQTKEEGFEWNGDDWEFRQTWEGEFDSNGRQLKSRFYYPDATTKEPVLSSVYTNEYDANGNRTLYQLESLPIDGSSKDLIVMQKQISKFDDASRQTLNEQYEYNFMTGFGGVSKEVVEYTGYEDNVAWYASYLWKDGDWFPNMKDVNSYENNIHTGVLRFGAGAKADEWVEQEKYEFSYNENGNMSRQNYYLKDKSGNWALEVYLLYYYPTGLNIEAANTVMADISVTNGVLDITGIRNHAQVQVYTPAGQLVHSVVSLGNNLSLSLPRGLYLVSIDGKSVKVLMR